MVMQNWQGLQVPARTPPAIVLRLATALRGALEDPAVRRSLELLGIEPLASSPEEMERLLAEDSVRWRTLIREAGIVPD